MDLEKIKQYIALFEESGLNKFSIKEGDFEISLEKGESGEKTIVHKTKIEEKEEEKNFISSPMVGTFYVAPAPDKKPFVKVGDHVTKDSVVCIIEAMKVLNEVKAGVSGMVKKVLCKNGKPVEFGTKLFEIKKNEDSSSK